MSALHKWRPLAGKKFVYMRYENDNYPGQVVYEMRGKARVNQRVYGAQIVATYWQLDKENTRRTFAKKLRQEKKIFHANLRNN